MTLPKTQINCIFKLLVQYFRLLCTIIALVQFSECNAQFLNAIYQNQLITVHLLLGVSESIVLMYGTR